MEGFEILLFLTVVILPMSANTHVVLNDTSPGSNQVTESSDPFLPQSDFSSFLIDDKPSPLITIKDPTYLVVVPRVVRAGYTYQLVVNILPPSPSLFVVATLLKDNIQLGVVERECHKEEPELMAITVPASSTAGTYRLKLEGNEFGGLTGTTFTTTVDLQFKHQGATIIIQTDRTVYKHGSTVMIKIVAIDLSTKVIPDPFDILILSPRGVIVKRWMSRQCLEGAIGVSFPLSQDCEEGEWTIRVEATNSFSEIQFQVSKFKNPRFEVRVELPAFLSSDEEFLRGTVYSSYPSGAPVIGNISVRAAWKPGAGGHFSFYGPLKSVESTRRTKNERRTTFWDAIFSSETNTTSSDQFGGIFMFRFRLSPFDYFLGDQNEGGEILVTATVGDAAGEITRTGFTSTKVFSPHIHLQFLGRSPHVLRPPMPFPFYITASMQDGSHVSSFRLAKHRLTVSPQVWLKNGEVRQLYPRSIKMTHDQYGLWHHEIDLPSELDKEDLADEISFLKLEAELKDALGRRSYASMIAVRHYSTENRYIQISTSSKYPKVGEYAIFHVRSNFYFDSFRFILMSKGMILESGQESMEASLKTFPVALTLQMAGTSSLFVYVLERGKDLVADVVTFPVDALTSDDFRIALEEDPTKTKIRVKVEGEPGSRVSLAGTIMATPQMQAEAEVSKSRILSELGEGPGSKAPNPSILQMKWISHTGFPEEVVRRAGISDGDDVNQTFNFAGLDLLTDGKVPSRPSPCEASRGFFPCLLGGCYSATGKCNGEWDCVDRIDEKECPQPWLKAEQDISSFKIHRQSWIGIDFAPPWLWDEVVLGEDGKAELVVVSPQKASMLQLTALSINSERCVNLLKEPLRITTNPSFWLWVEAPKRVGVWEQVGIQVTLVNRLEVELPVEVLLEANPNYRFISLEEFEITQPQPSFRARHPNAVKRRSANEVTDTSHGHRHSITIPAQDTTTLFLPIMPTSTGPLTVPVKANFPASSATKSITIFVEPLGVRQEKQTSFLMDLTHRAYAFTFLDVQLPPHLPLLSGARVHLSLFGDVVGGNNQESIVTPVDTLGLPQIGGESLGFSLWMTVAQLERWSWLGQRPEVKARRVFSRLSLLYQTLLSLQNSDGGFQFFESSRHGCVWLTAFILRSLCQISTKWSHLLYVDPLVTDKALRFVLKHQTSHGAFYEPGRLLGIRQLDQGSNHVLNQMSTRGLNFSSTALTLIHLRTLHHLPEPLDSELKRSMQMGRVWLEDNLELIEEASKPLEVTLVVLALHLLDSRSSERAFTLLARNGRQEGKQYVYWGEDLVPPPSYRVEDNRPYLQPRQSHRHDSGNIAATACALRVYASRGELLTTAIVRWLQSQRAHDGGWMSTFDTMMAWDALQEYSNMENNSINTRLVITIEPMTELRNSKVFYVTPSNLLMLQTHDMGPDLGSITVQGKGQGSAVLQLTLEYFVSEASQVIPPPVRAFDLKTTAISSGRNASRITFHTCTTWKYSMASETSGIAVLELTIPTGYGIPTETLRDYVNSRRVPALRYATFRPRLISFYFSKVGPTSTCLDITVTRWFPVANLTRILPVKIYEYYSPELFAVELVDLSSSITLDICQVCGSYQCPNCPVLSYYSSHAPHLPSPDPFALFLRTLYTSISISFLGAGLLAGPFRICGFEVR